MKKNSTTETARYNGSVFFFANSEIIRLLLTPTSISKIKQDLNQDIISNSELNSFVGNGKLLLNSYEPHIKTELTMFFSCVNKSSMHHQNLSANKKSMRMMFLVNLLNFTEIKKEEGIQDLNQESRNYGIIIYYNECKTGNVHIAFRSFEVCEKHRPQHKNKAIALEKLKKII